MDFSSSYSKIFGYTDATKVQVLLSNAFQITDSVCKSGFKSISADSRTSTSMRISKTPRQ